MAGSFGKPTFLGITLSKTWVPKKLLRSAATCFEKVVRSSYIVSRIPSISEGWVYRSAKPHEGVQQIRDALNGEVLALNRDDHRITGCERINGEEVEGWRAINKNIRKYAHGWALSLL